MGFKTYQNILFLKRIMYRGIKSFAMSVIRPTLKCGDCERPRRWQVIDRWICMTICSGDFSTPSEPPIPTILSQSTFLYDIDNSHYPSWSSWRSPAIFLHAEPLTVNINNVSLYPVQRPD